MAAHAQEQSYLSHVGVDVATCDIERGVYDAEGVVSAARDLFTADELHVVTVRISYAVDKSFLDAVRKKKAACDCSYETFEHLLRLVGSSDVFVRKFAHVVKRICERDTLGCGDRILELFSLRARTFEVTSDLDSAVESNMFHLSECTTAADVDLSSFVCNGEITEVEDNYEYFDDDYSTECCSFAPSVFGGADVLDDTEEREIECTEGISNLSILDTEVDELLNLDFDKVGESILEGEEGTTAWTQFEDDECEESTVQQRGFTFDSAVTTMTVDGDVLTVEEDEESFDLASGLEYHTTFPSESLSDVIVSSSVSLGI